MRPEPPYISRVEPPHDPVVAARMRDQMRPSPEPTDPRVNTLLTLLDRADNAEQLRALVQVLHPGACEERIQEWIRAGVSGGGGGSRSAEAPVPHLDAHDVAMQILLESYGQHLADATQLLRENAVRKAAAHLEKARAIETGVLVERHMRPDEWTEYKRKMRIKAEEEAATVGRECANENCTHTITGGPDDPMINHRCRRCARYLIKNGYERPLSLCERDVEREVLRAANDA